MSADNQSMVNDTLEQINAEREAEAKKKIRCLIQRISTNQETIKAATADMAAAKKELAQVNYVPMTLAELA